MIRLCRLVVAVLVLGCPAAGWAQQPSGIYVGAGAGVNFWHESSSNGLRLTTQNPGVAALGSVGWAFGNGWRTEIEGNFRANSLDGVSVGGVPATMARGQTSFGTLNTYGVMANALFDFDLSGFGLTPDIVIPYVGGGIGYGWYDLGNAAFRLGNSTYRFGGTDGEFAFQGIAGAAWGLNGLLPGLSLTTEYRFYGTLQPSIGVNRSGGPAQPSVPSAIKPENYNHSLLLGLRYSFGGAPAIAAAEAVAPPASPARTFLVFFDWDRADLSDRAKQIIAEAAQNARRVQSTRIEVAGHADRSGALPYNLALSRRRGETVAAELVRLGIDRNEIAIQAFGETRPLVPTADGVREPQNRRVEIVLR